MNRRGLRWFVALRRTLKISLAQRRLCLVRRRKGIESIRYSNGMVIPIVMPRTPEQLREAASLFFRAYRPRRGDVVVDAGAGIGDEVLVFASLVGKRGNVVAIEAHPASFERLTTLCRLNDLPQVRCVQVALANKPGTTYITDSERVVANSVVAGDRTLPVPADTLDHVLSRLGIGHVDFLKMNIERAELQALEGFARGLPLTQNVAIACHDRRADDGESDAFRTRAGVLAVLEAGGFQLVEVQMGGDPWESDYIYARAGSLRTGGISITTAAPLLSSFAIAASQAF